MKGHNTISIQKILQQEAKVAIPIPERVIDIYMKNRDELNPENRNLQKLSGELSAVLNKAYPDRQSLAEKALLTLFHIH